MRSSQPWSFSPARRRRAVVPIVSAIALLLMVVAPASAASQSVSVDRTLTAGPADLGGTTYHVDSIFDSLDGDITVTAEASFSQPIRETLEYDDADIRQGGTTVVERSVATNGPGTLSVTWDIDGDYGSFSESASAPCTVSFSGPVTCSAESDEFRLFGQVPVPGTPIFDLVLQAEVKVTPDGAMVVSTELAGTTTIGGPADQAEPGTQSIDLPCTVGVGATLAVSDADYVHATSMASSNGPAIEIGAWIPIPVPPFVIEADFAQVDLGPQHAETFEQALTDATTKVSELGQIAPNNVPPNAAAGGPYSGVEGTAIQFDATASTSICGFDALTFRWDFSDGGVAFGPEPFHTFEDDGILSGQVTATDPTGLSDSANFSVTVSNVDPVADAGPDTTADWGRPVTFGGTATDPGAGDQSTLEYSWDFGDGTPPTEPSGAGGSGVVHAYAAPGEYVATLTVTDKDGGVDTDTRTVVVTRRSTTTAYLAPSSATFDTPTSLSASLVDEYGANLNAKPIAFTVDGASAGSASTNSSGIATRSYTPAIGAGDYGTDASFAGDALYLASSDSGSLSIARKATTVTYTGALNGGPNKTIGLSAILADASGTRLAGRTIAFQLGSQSTSAVTDASGVASVDLKLSQKNGIYPLMATYTPAGADASRYLGSSDAESFKLQKK